LTIFSANNLSKSFDRGNLFVDLSFGMESGDRVGIIGKNGIGKTTLMNIIANKEVPDTGEVVFNNAVRFEYLNQMPEFDKFEIVIDAVMKAKPRIYQLINEHSELCSKLNKEFDQTTSDKIDKITQEIDHLGAWNHENDAKTILTKLNIFDFNARVQTLSGGFRKRVALARALLSEPDLLILDEPTNHLDADSVQWLQDRLMNTKQSILFITHDRYFIDAVANKIVEIDNQKILTFPGNYETYLERKENLIQVRESEVDHLHSRLRMELAWLQRGAKARRTKQQSRIDWIGDLKKQTHLSKDKKIKIEIGKTFLGKRIIEAVNISKEIGGKQLFTKHDYIAKPGDRIGIIGPNGSGKSTLLNVLAGLMPVDTGTVKIGPSIVVGYFKQENEDLDNMQSVQGSLREIAEFIDCGVGKDRFLTTKDLLNRFNFPPRQHSSLIATLSGGEKRRLALLRVLMSNPNVLFLDEPTNDLDIQTLNAIESYLDDFYGVLIVVSHDRAFLDRTVNFILAFDGKGGMKEYPGNYSIYLEKKEENQSKLVKVAKKDTRTKAAPAEGKKKKLSYKDQREFDGLEKEIADMEEEKTKLEAFMSASDGSNYKELEDASNKIKDLEDRIDTATMRWIELDEMVE
jgi:ABC transport system ATP-binding/permease protein